MPDKNKQGRIFLLDRAKAAQTGTIWLSLFQEPKTLRDLVGGANIANPGGFITDTEGGAATFNGSQQQNLSFTFPGANSDNIIIAARIKATATQAADPGAAFGIYASAGNQSGIGVGFNTSNDVGATWLDNNGAGTTARSAGAQNVWYTVFVQALSDNRMYAWINGKPATTSQGATHSAVFATLNEISIGAQHRSSGFLRNFTGNIEWASLIYAPPGGKNPIPDAYAEFLYKSNYPYSLEAKPNRIWVSAGGGTDTPVNPAVGSLAITGYAPVVAQTANQSIAPNVGNIVITGYAPSISQPLAVNPAVGSLTITGYAPTVTQNVDFPVNPGVGTIAITGYAPTVSQTANQSVLPAVGNVAITGYSPTVTQSANQAVVPDVGSISITGYSPTIQQAPASQILVPTAGTIAITGYSPTVKQSEPVTKIGGDDAPRIEIYEKRKPAKKQDKLEEIIRAAYKKATGSEPEQETVEIVAKEVNPIIKDEKPLFDPTEWIAQKQVIIEQIIKLKQELDDEEAILLLI